LLAKKVINELIQKDLWWTKSTAMQFGPMFQILSMGPKMDTTAL